MTPVPTRARRHTIATVTRARALADAGWNPAAIRRFLIKEGHVTEVSLETVSRWIDPDAHADWQNHIRRHNGIRAARRGARPMGNPQARPEFKVARAQALRERGLSHNAIAKVMNFDFPTADPVDEQKIRYVLNTGRWPNKLEVLA